jgi:serine/alanine adding enzyme
LIVLTIEVNPDISPEEWRTFVGSHPQGNYYHLPEWQAVLKESLGQKPYYVFARSPEGKLTGILPLFHLKSILTGSRLISLPFANACGPIADSPDTIEALVNRAKGLRDEMKCQYLEIRMTKPLSPSLELNDYFSTYVVELSEPQAMWKKLDKRVRWVVDKARKGGTVVKIDNSDKGLQAFYDLNLRTKRRLGVPAHTIGFFKAMRKHMNPYFRIYLAEVEGKVIAGALDLSFNGVVGYAYAASDSSYLQYYPNDAIAWQAIQDSSHEGFRQFDFGKTSSDNVGLAQFKKKWGAEKRPLYYYYYPKKPHLISSNRTGIKYKLVTGLWRRLPLPILRVLSPIAFRQLD